MIQITISEVILWLTLFLVLLSVGFLCAFIYFLNLKIREMQQFSHGSFIASIAAFARVQSIKESGIIQKVVEKHHFIDPAQKVAQEKLMAEAEAEFESLMDPTFYRPSRHEPKKKEDFQVEETYQEKTGLDPEDLV